MQHHKWAALAVLTLGLCLVTTDAFADDEFTLINSAGDTIQARCQSETTWTDVANGATSHFTCQTTLHMRPAGSTADESVSNSCGLGQTVTVTVTHSSAAAFIYSDSCTD